MKDYYLKFEDEAAAKAALVNAGFTTDEDSNVYHEECAVDWVGVIQHVSGTEEEPIITTVDGYHVNVRTWSDDLTFQPEHIMEPATPVRVWA
ncbi:MAG: hypothetical protein ACRC9H_05240 [Aeromonas veronii]